MRGWYQAGAGAAKQNRPAACAADFPAFFLSTDAGACWDGQNRSTVTYQKMNHPIRTALKCIAISTALGLGLSSCALLPNGDGSTLGQRFSRAWNAGSSQESSSSSSLSKCWPCSGMGYKKDPNSGNMEMCVYCNGSGLN
jgi:hypothetical protein